MKDEKAYVLVTGVSEHDDWEACQSGDWALPFNNINLAALGEGVASGEVVDDQHDEIGDRDQRDEGRVLETVQAAEEGEGDHY